MCCIGSRNKQCVFVVCSGCYRISTLHYASESCCSHWWSDDAHIRNHRPGRSQRVNMCTTSVTTIEQLRKAIRWLIWLLYIVWLLLTCIYFISLCHQVFLVIPCVIHCVIHSHSLELYDTGTRLSSSSSLTMVLTPCSSSSFQAYKPQTWQMCKMYQNVQRQKQHDICMKQHEATPLKGSRAHHHTAKTSLQNAQKGAHAHWITHRT